MGRLTLNVLLSFAQFEREVTGERIDLSLTASIQDVIPHLARIDLHADAIVIKLWRATAPTALRRALPIDVDDAKLLLLDLSMRAKVRGGRSWITAPGVLATPARRDRVLIRPLSRAHQLVATMGFRTTDGSCDRPNVAAPAHAYDRKLCRLAFLAPDLQSAILEGRQPAGLTLGRLINDDIPLAWEHQRALFGNI